MTDASSHPTRIIVRLTALLALAVVAAAGLSAARDFAPPPQGADQSGRPPEDEDPDARPISHPVTSDEPDDAGPKTVAAPRAVDLKIAARDAKNDDVKSLFFTLAVPHDQVKFNEFMPKRENRAVNIAPIPDLVGDKLDTISWPLEVTPFAGTNWAPTDPIKLQRKYVDHITPYERLALDAVDAFLNRHYEKPTDPKKILSRYDQDVAAAQVLTTVLLRLQSARQTKARSGAAWDAVEDSLKQRLLGVLLEELDDRVQARQWDDACALTKELARTYRSPQDQIRIAGPLAGLVRDSLASVDEKQRAEARQRLRQLEDLFPDSALIQPVSDELKKQAQELFDAAKQENNREQRDRLLDEAREAWPGLPGLRSYVIQQSNQHPTLRVGVRELPARMSPGLASTDSDLRAVELLFESLVKLEPDGAGGARWAPGLALGRPGLVPHGRRFQLPPEARWSSGERMTARDVAETVNLIKAGRLTYRPRAWGAKLDRIDNIADPYQVYLTLPQGWLDPLALMNFKVLPPGVDPDSPDFAANPHGSGPYVYDKDVFTDEGRRCVVFKANPNYAARPGKAGLPRIDEIHFIAYTFQEEKDFKNDHKDDLTAALQDGPGRLDLLLDLNAREAAALARNAADLHVKLTGRAAPNRRIYFLAVNNEKSQLDNAAFRCALAYAINRDALLNQFFRATPGQDLHSPLNGPYPVGSWAANPKEVVTHGDKTTLDPWDVELAKAKLRESGVRDATITLKYPSGDPLVAAAMTELAQQVNRELGVTLELKAVSPDQLRDDVERDHNYALAYYHYDFPDDVYWLGPLLDGGPKENLLGYNGEKGQLSSMIQDLSRRRDFPEVRDWAYQIHDKFLKEEMPFIPLWQLDPLAAIHTDVVTPSSDPPFDPVLVFPEVERWALRRK